jgi:SAM-dependent methyltransferase
MDDPARSSPERFDPSAEGGKLVHSEHVARYVWAAEVAGGRTVLDAGCGTGYGSLILASFNPERLVAIDVAPEAVAQTADRLGRAGEASVADARELPFEDHTFGLIVCFETIEHISEAPRALAEFARTLRPDGVLLISSPNPRLYLQGNPHHVHEYVPEELDAALQEHFAHVALAGQRAWLGSLIASEDELNGLMLPDQKAVSAMLPVPGADREGTYVLAAAGHHAAQLPSARLVVGDAFEVKWWIEQVAGAEARTGEAIRQREIVAAHAHQTDQRLRTLEARLVELEQDRARLLTERPRLEQSVQELARARVVITDLQDSVSWKLTAPLRSAKRSLRRARPPQP